MFVPNFALLICAFSIHTGVVQSETQQGVLNVAKTFKQYNDMLVEANDKLVVVDCMAPNCVPCKEMEPKLKEFAKTYQDVVFIQVDTDDVFEVLNGEQATLPTIKFMKQSKKVETVMGGGEKKIKEIEEKIQKLKG